MSGGTPDRSSTGKWGLREYVHVAGLVAAAALATFWRPASYHAVEFPILVVAAVSGLLAFAQSRRVARRVREARAQGRWPLGEPYEVELDIGCSGSRAWHRLQISEAALEFADMKVFGASLRSPLRDISAIRVRASWIEIAETQGVRIRLVPRSYADRQRLLWELAVRVPDAFEFAAEDAPPGVPAPAPEPVDLTHTPTGLASALAGPDRSANPPPPRNAGLGCGLFPGVAPTEDDE